MNRINSFKNEIPLPIRLFLGKALLFFVAWKVLYSVFLFDSKVVDHKLTTHVGESSVFLLNNMGFKDGFTAKRKVVDITLEGETVSKQSSLIYYYDKLVLYIEDGCNGLELMVLYIGFIVCMPSSFSRKLRYVIFGVLTLDFLNVLRSVGLIYLNEYFNAYFDFAHHYLFKAIVYTATFLIWRMFARKIQLKDETIQE